MEWTIFYQAWTDTIELTASKNVLLQGESEKMSTTGGWTASNGADVEPLITVALATMTGPKGLLSEGGLWSCSEVLNVETQVVAGINYKITATFVNSVTGASENILLTIYVAPGAEPVLTSATPLMMERILQIGGWKESSKDSVAVKDIISAGLTQMTTVGGVLGQGEWSCTTVENVQTQVVAGINYKITAIFTSTSGSTQTIEFVMYVAPGQSPVLTSATPLMLGRNLQIGGYKESSKDSVTVKNVIAAGLTQMTTVGGALGEGLWSCTSVENVQTQVVAGINYKITAIFTNASTGKTQTIEFVMYVAPGQTPVLTSATPLMLGN